MIMKNALYSLTGLVALAGLALAVSSCRGGQNNGNEVQNNIPTQKGIDLQMETVYTDNPVSLSATIFPDSIVVVRDSVPHTYVIDKEKSFESIDIMDYVWNFVVSGKGSDCPPCDTISIDMYMTDLYGEKSKWDYDRLILHNGENSTYCRILNEPEIPRRLFANYPESKPFPELVMENTRFYYGYQVDSAKVPGFISAVKRVVIKDNTISFSDGEKTTTLEMIPLSDRESVYSEGYDWYFLTKKTETCPGLSFNLNAGFDFERKQLKPEERWISMYIKDIGEIQFDFRSWDNLKRKISVYYPSEQEFQNTMEEGILPDYSDEEE